MTTAQPASLSNGLFGQNFSYISSLEPCVFSGTFTEKTRLTPGYLTSGILYTLQLVDTITNTSGNAQNRVILSQSPTERP